MRRPIILNSTLELKDWRNSCDKAGASVSIGFVPTMGSLHEGHLSLVRESAKNCTETIVSIFVNPLQFGKNEDFSNYPRDLEKDLELLSSASATAVFCPDSSDFYSKDHSTFVSEESMTEVLCGEFRPGHFKGVTTVVLKLFNLTRPNLAFFGQKDFQQCAVLKKMVRDLSVPVEMRVLPTVRESDGLAMSSRNAYLSPSERALAPNIYQALIATKAAYQAGKKSYEELIQIGPKLLENYPEFKIQYWQIVDAETLGTYSPSHDAVLACAVYLGKTRLIDNILF